MTTEADTTERELTRGQSPVREPERCPCGQPLHYDSPALKQVVERLAGELGPTIPVHTFWGSWAVSRQFIALQGLVARDVPSLAAKYGFTRIA